MCSLPSVTAPATLPVACHCRLPKGAGSCWVPALKPPVTSATCKAGQFKKDVLKPGSCTPKWDAASYTNWKLSVKDKNDSLITLGFKCIDGTKTCQPIPDKYKDEAVFYKVRHVYV